MPVIQIHSDLVKNCKYSNMLCYLTFKKSVTSWGALIKRPGRFYEKIIILTEENVASFYFEKHNLPWVAQLLPLSYGITISPRKKFNEERVRKITYNTGFNVGARYISSNISIFPNRPSNLKKNLN